MFKYDCSGLVRFRGFLASCASEELLRECAAELADRLSEVAISGTPVDTGRLAGGYEVAEISASGGFLSAELVNSVEYASFVEFGHRTPNHKDWVPGRYMLTLAASEVQAMAPEILENRILEFLEGCISGGQ